MTAARRTDDLAAAPSERRWSPLAAWLVFVLAWIGACGTAVHAPQLSEVGDSPGSAAGCSAGSTGCACPNEGASAACGRVESQSGNYVTCSVGHSTCTGGSWGPCAGDHLVTKSRADVALTSGGIRVLSGAIACPNACDPNGCRATQSSPDDVDA